MEQGKYGLVARWAGVRCEGSGCLSIGGLEMAGSDARWGGGASWAGLACGVGLMGCAWYGLWGFGCVLLGRGEEKVVAGVVVVV